jgi:CheY-like chemotaxis protein
MDNTILVVDDNPVNRKLLSSILVREGYNSLEATDGEEALRIARDEDPDVILLDVMMPGMDGFSVCQRMRQDPMLEDTPVLFLTAKTEVSERIKGFDAGGNDYITKPYHQSEVLARVRRSLSLRRKAVRQRRRQTLVEDSERSLKKSHESAVSLTRGMLPLSGAGGSAMETAWWQTNPEGVCGEMFNVLALGAGSYAVFLLDAGGQDLAAAANAISLMKLLNAKPGGLLKPKSQADGQATAPDKVLADLDRSVGLKGIDTFFYMQYMLLDAATGVLSYANVGGKPYPLVIRMDGSREWLSGERPTAQSGSEDFYQGQVKLAKGDRVYLMSDGVAFSGANQGKPYGEGRVEALLAATRARDLADNIATVDSALQAYSGDAEPRSMLAFEFLGPQTAA